MKLADLATREYFDNPYPLYEKLRAEGRVVRVGPTAVMSGHYEVVDSILHDRRFGKRYLESIRVRYGDDAPQMKLFQGFSRMFLVLNPPVHTRLRSLMMKAFNARQVEAMKDVAQRACHELIDAFEHEATADITRQFAFHLPVSIIGRMLDIPVEEATRLGVGASVVAKTFDLAPLSPDDLVRATAAYEELERYFIDVIDARRARLGDDLISRLLTVEENGEKLSQDEIVSNVILLFVAGHETTSNMIGNSLIALHRHPEQLALLKRDPARMPQAVLECLRYDSSVQSTVRTLLEETEIDGVEMPSGTAVFVMMGSANRDPAKFTHPERLDIDRDEGRVQSFGAGIHHCIGYRLALIELETALRVLFERLPALELTELDRLSWNQHGNLRGVTSLVARW
ncbi:cytochrome P450 [Paraburkholderia humisilvae]|uniref:Cytochrome P450 monooxygenase PikC n=1 Tax=Paraburkholderia humisilvae TaxID=627669 RepID=A0A6J5DFE0_9BURK|nr:cytochrome P450 [Paraburkholderia humisilvae]CAB3751882.1 Cytochrome P450 monooxygenase PikC [Paraburkholderia humisilvae]